MQLSDELNEQQRRAAVAGDGPVLIVAGPGTGKTKTLTARIAFLLEQGTKPSEIVALTFTKKAANEMLERLKKLPGSNETLPQIITFHALGHDLLKENAADKELISEQTRAEITHGLTKPAVFKGLGPRELSLIISRAKTSLTKTAEAPTQKLLAQYEATLDERQLHDFDDFLCKAYDLLRQNPDKRPKYKYVLVDEFQDTSELQYEILKLLGAGENIFAIGDPNQSIYAFRGAGAEMFDRFHKDFLSIKVITININYRSCPEIIALANAIFPDAPQLKAHHKSSGKIQAVQTLNEYSEAAYVLNEIEQGIGGSDMLKATGDQHVRQPRDYAVLYRTHRAAKALQKTFKDAGIPCQIAGEGSPYERPALQTLIASLRYLQNPGDAPVPKLKSLTDSQTKILLKAVQITDKTAICDAAAELAKTLNLDDENIAPFCGGLVQFGAGRASFDAALKHIDDIREREFYDPTVNAVTLLTIHSSKGLEFEHVFLIAAEEGILPKLNRAGDGNIDEEKRLFYVAATRAKQTLEILHAKFRGGQPAEPSRFLAEIPDEILPKTTDPDLENQQRKAKKRAAKRAQTSLF